MRKEYQTYMDAVEVSPALHQRLLGLSVPRRGDRRRRYGSLAAALAVLIGAAGLVRLTLWAPGEQADSTTDPTAAQNQLDDTLPHIAYGTDSSESSQLDLDYILPEGSTLREVTGEDVLALVGGETALDTLLGWEGLTWGGQGIFLSDGSLWHLYLWGEGPDLALSLDLLAGDTVPPDCVITEADTVTDVMGTLVKGYTGGIYGKADDETGETVLWLPESRTVEFAANGAGYRLQVYGSEGDGERVEELVSRFVLLAVRDGLNLSMTPAAP